MNQGFIGYCRAVPDAKGLAIQGDRLYVAYDAGGLRVIDIARPRIVRIRNTLELGEVEVSEAVKRALVNLLDNAVSFSPPG